MKKFLDWILVLLEVKHCINMPNIRSHLPGTQTVGGYFCVDLWMMMKICKSLDFCAWVFLMMRVESACIYARRELVEVALDSSSQGSEDAWDLIAWLSSDTWASAVSLCSESEKSRQMNVVHCLWNFLPLMYCFLMSAYRTQSLPFIYTFLNVV